MQAELTEQVAAEIPVYNVDPTEAYKRGEVDINFFAGLAIPQVMVSPFPLFYISIFQMLINRAPEQIGRILRFALGLPRGHAKTTFIKVIIAWLIVYDKAKFVVVICASKELALAIVDDINDILGSSNIESIYGKWDAQLSTDSKELKKAFYHGRNVTIAAKGELSGLRGLNIKHERPDVILFDDAQTKECDESLVESAKFKRRFTATLKIIAPKGDRLVVYIGNMYSENCMLYKLKCNSRWISLVTGAILEDGQPLWPELYSLEDLLDGYLHDLELGEEDVWFAEVMNDPIVVSLSLIANGIPRYEELFETVVPDGVFLTIDPAGMKSSSDDNVIATHYVHNGKGVLRRLNAGIKDPESLIKEALSESMEEGVSVIGIEESGYQGTLLFWMNKYIKEWGIRGITVVPLRPKNRSKESRIRTFVFEVLSREYNIHDEARAAWIWQAMKYKIGKKDNKDDILDAAAYGIDMRTEYWHLITNLRRAALESSAQAQIPLNNTPF